MLAPSKIPESSAAVFDQPDGVARGVFEPPSGFAVWAIARNKLVVFVVAVVLALAGVGVGAKRRSTYTASATVQVGQVNPNSPGFFGYSQSSATLANAFSRSIAAEPVLAAVQKKLKLAPAQAVARLSAEPIPEAPAFRVIATGSSELGAIDLANVAANAVIAYEGQSNSANPEAASLLEEYRAASLKLQQAVRAVGDLSRKKGASLEALARVEADRNAAAVRLKAIGVAYTSAVASQAPRSGLVSLLAGAASASSDRSSRVELYGFIGLLVGVVVGCFVAVLRERRRAASRRAAVRDEIERVEPVA